MLLNILPHVRPHTRMWRVPQNCKFGREIPKNCNVESTIKLQIGGRDIKELQGGEEKQMRETNMQIVKRWLEPMTSCQTKL